MLLCNRAYGELWGVRDGLPDRPLVQEIALWRQADPEATVWDRIGASGTTGEETGTTEARLVREDGRHLQMRLLPLGRGRLAAEFTDAAQATDTAREMRLVVGRT